MNRPFLPNERTAPPNAIRSQIVKAIIANERLPKGAGKVDKGAVTFTATQSALSQPNYVTDIASFVGFGLLPAVAPKAATTNFTDEGSTTVIANHINAQGMLTFTEQGQPLHVKQTTFSSTTLIPRKAGVIHVATRTLLQSSNAESLLRHDIAEGLPASVDTVMLDANASDNARPAGLRYGISAETSGGANAMLADLTLLASNVATIAGRFENIIILADPKTAIKIAIALPHFPFQIVPTNGLAAGTVVALAANALAIGAGSEIRYETSTVAAIHMEDASPADIGTVGTPNAIAAPVRSMLQTDCVAMKFIFTLDYKLRVANSLSWMTSIAW